MPTYTKDDYQSIAAAIGADAADVISERNHFEGAAAWVRLGARRGFRHTPAATAKKLDQIRSAAVKLLGHLGVGNFDNRSNDLPPEALLRRLQLDDDPNEEVLANSTFQIHRLVEILDAVDAARDLKRRAEIGARDEKQVGGLIVQEGNSANDVENGWIADMMAIYRRITGKNPTTSIGSPGSKNSGNPTGPFLRFLRATSAPVSAELDRLRHKGDFAVDFELTDKAWRSRVRNIKRAEGRQKRI